jgi:hypothetical protein
MLRPRSVAQTVLDLGQPVGDVSGKRGVGEFDRYCGYHVDPLIGAGRPGNPL